MPLQPVVTKDAGSLARFVVVAVAAAAAAVVVVAAAAVAVVAWLLLRRKGRVEIIEMTEVVWHFGVSAQEVVTSPGKLGLELE